MRAFSSVNIAARARQKQSVNRHPGSAEPRADGRSSDEESVPFVPETPPLQNVHSETLRNISLAGLELLERSLVQTGALPSLSLYPFVAGCARREADLVWWRLLRRSACPAVEWRVDLPRFIGTLLRELRTNRDTGVLLRPLRSKLCSGLRADEMKAYLVHFDEWVVRAEAGEWSRGKEPVLPPLERSRHGESAADVAMTHEPGEEGSAYTVLLPVM